MSPLPRRRSPFAWLIALAAGILVLGLCVALGSPPDRPPDLEASTLLLYGDARIVAFVRQGGLGGFAPDDIEKFGSHIVERALARGREPEAFAASLFPSPSQSLALLARDRDVDDYLENAEEDGAAGDYYAKVAELVAPMRPLREAYEALFRGVYAGLAERGRTRKPAGAAKLYYSGGLTAPGLSSRPRKAELDYSHTYALDVFLDEVRTIPGSGLEVGPELLALEGGIVVCTASDWRGGEELEDYRSGGITPKAGNGLVIYSPRSRRYYLYFHLYDVALRPGQAIAAGQVLGRGGNTGSNARKPGHGEHVHVEVFDLAAGRFLRNTEILRLAFD